MLEPPREVVRAALASAYFAKGRHQTELGDFKGALSNMRSSLRAFPRRSTYTVAADLQIAAEDAAQLLALSKACAHASSWPLRMAEP